MSDSGSQRQFPKAVIHKQILEVAEANPDASIEGIADEISGASPDLVERVLDTYGDPGGAQSGSAESPPAAVAADTKYDSPGLAREENRTAPQAVEQQAHTDMDAEATGDAPAQHSDSDPDAELEGTEMSEPDSESVLVDRDDISEKQWDVLRAIRERPEATQRELAEQFDVTPATISRWVNDIPGFEWQDRQAFVTHQFDTTTTVSDGGSRSQNALDDRVAEIEARLDEIEDGFAALRDRLDGVEQAGASAGAGADGSAAEAAAIDPELYAKLVRACLADDRIDDEEEQAIITALR